jgi:hypothetical protein
LPIGAAACLSISPFSIRPLPIGSLSIESLPIDSLFIDQLHVEQLLFNRQLVDLRLVMLVFLSEACRSATSLSTSTCVDQKLRRSAPCRSKAYRQVACLSISSVSADQWLAHHQLVDQQCFYNPPYQSTAFQYNNGFWKYHSC